MYFCITSVYYTYTCICDVQHVTTYVYVCTYDCNSARNKDQKLVSHFSENRIFYRRLTIENVWESWILVGQMLKLSENGQ